MLRICYTSCMTKLVKRLYKSQDNKVLAGVCGGIGEYFDIDPVLVRLAYLLLTVFTAFAPGIIGYVIAAMIIPEEPLHPLAKVITPEPSESHDSEAI